MFLCRVSISSVELDRYDAKTAGVFDAEGAYSSLVRLELSVIRVAAMDYGQDGKFRSGEFR